MKTFNKCVKMEIDKYQSPWFSEAVKDFAHIISEMKTQGATPNP